MNAEADFEAVSDTCWKWHGGGSDGEMFINSGRASLWTDGGNAWIDEKSLERLQQLAAKLGGRVVMEDGEGIEDAVPVSGLPATKGSRLVAGLFVLPLLVLSVLLVPIALLRALFVVPFHLLRKKP